MADIVLTAIKGGIDRQRVQGSPSPDVLYEFENGYRDPSGVLRARPGSVSTHDLPAGQTKGLVAFRGGFVVFSHAPQTVPHGVTCEVLVHPTDSQLPLTRIHFAAPILQYLYVAAEFAGGDVFHYWLQHADPWEANHGYCLGNLAEPTVPNGLVYIAERVGDPNPLWTAGAQRAVGDRVEPTTADCNYYEVIDTIGDDPRSGALEPTWQTDDGALTYEDTSTGIPVTPPTTGPSTGTPNPDPTDRYGNPGGRIDYREEQ